MKKRRGPKSLRDLPIVEVVWDDTTTHEGWHNAATAQQLAFARCRTVGRLLHASPKNGLTLCAMIGPDEGLNSEVGHVARIPGPWVRSLRRLR